MIQKSGVHQFDMVVCPIIYRGFIHVRWLFGISAINSMSVRFVCVCFFEDVPLHGVFLRFEGLETQV